MEASDGAPPPPGADVKEEDEEEHRGTPATEPMRCFSAQFLKRLYLQAQEVRGRALVQQETASFRSVHSSDLATHNQTKILMFCCAVLWCTSASSTQHNEVFQIQTHYRDLFGHSIVLPTGGKSSSGSLLFSLECVSLCCKVSTPSNTSQSDPDP